jgi:hypothetical protein
MLVLEIPLPRNHFENFGLQLAETTWKDVRFQLEYIVMLQTRFGSTASRSPQKRRVPCQRNQFPRRH